MLIPYEKYQRMLKACQESRSRIDPDNKVEVTSSTNDDHRELDNESINIPHPHSEPGKENKLSESDIILHVPKKLKSQAKTLLDVIDRNPHLDWNQRGELLADGEVIERSHIVDLLKDALVQYKHFHPVGVREFNKHLTNIPISLIQNPERRSFLQQKGEGDLPQPPPPGLPNKRKAVSIETAGSSGSVNRENKEHPWKKLWKTL